MATLDLFGLTGDMDTTDPAALEARRNLALAMMQRGQGTPATSAAQGIANVLNSMLGAYNLRKTDEADKKGRKEADALLLEALGGASGGGSSPVVSITPAPSSGARPVSVPSSGGMREQSTGDLASRIEGAESGGDPNAKNPRSSATGPGQFIDSTWLSTIKKHLPTLAQGKSDAQLLSLRSDRNVSREMTNAYARDNAEELQAAGLPAGDGELSLAHFAGSGGAKRVLRADPATPVSQLLTPAAMAANPFLRKMTAGDLRAWANKRVGADRTITASSGADTMSGGDGLGPVIPSAPTQSSAIAALARKLMSNPRTADQGRALLIKSATMQAPDKPAAIQEYEYAVRQGYGKTFAEFQTEQKQAGRTQINNTVGAGETALSRSLGEQTAKSLSSGQETAQSAANAIENGYEARKLLDSGMISGTGANVRTAIGDAMVTAGLIDAGSDEAEKLANTRAFVSTMGRQTLDLVKQLGAGSGISNADRDFAEKVSGGSIELTPPALRRILDINEKVSRRYVSKHNERVKRVLGDKDQFGLSVAEPGDYVPGPVRTPQLPDPRPLSPPADPNQPRAVKTERIEVPKIGSAVSQDQFGALPDGAVIKDEAGVRYRIQGGQPVPIK